MGRAGSVRGPVRRRGREGASQRPGTNAGRPAAGRRVAAARRATVRRDRRTSRNERGGVPDAVRPRTARRCGRRSSGRGRRRDLDRRARLRTRVKHAIATLSRKNAILPAEFRSPAFVVSKTRGLLQVTTPAGAVDLWEVPLRAGGTCTFAQADRRPARRAPAAGPCTTPHTRQSPILWSAVHVHVNRTGCACSRATSSRA